MDGRTAAVAAGGGEGGGGELGGGGVEGGELEGGWVEGGGTGGGGVGGLGGGDVAGATSEMVGRLGGTSSCVGEDSPTCCFWRVVRTSCSIDASTAVGRP